MDHIVLNVRDVERALTWYTEKLGLEVVRVEEWRARTVPFPSVRLNSSTIIDFFSTSKLPDDASNAPTNLNHFCVVVDPTILSELIVSGHFTAEEIVQPPCKRFGARGDGTSLYVRDPDGNEVEVRYYPWNPDDAVQKVHI
ncbi:dioxygenase [Gonapodya prolifera JEL478]|uniref:Dioxygenase n=1 Tax=Gonapodya prolifera (strain JEL478) TaxID=1344416 RepID=A0A139A1V0_GONPJ|nr:dioxygenase [Gonapodya prolifera JEL478]|eukprot:KXS10669.1 dioxygenase [Gonapodya prolifera JEL478]